MDITEGVVAVLSTSIVVGIPMTALAIRFALKPALETWLEVRKAVAPRVSGGELEGLKLRVAALEAVLEDRLSGGKASPLPMRGEGQGEGLSVRRERAIES